MKVNTELKERINHLKTKTGLLRRVVSYSLLALCGILVFSVIGYFLTIPRFPIQIQNEGYSVYEGEKTVKSTEFDPASGVFGITTNSGAVWKSNLDEKTSKADGIAKGINRITLMSQLVIQYVDNDNRIYVATSYANALADGKKSLQAQRAGEVVTAVYEFTTGKAAEGLKIAIPVEFAFRDGSLQVRILTDQIKENKDYKLLNISLLPYFGAASKTEDGYLLIPDGSGALISFQSENSGAQEWTGTVYGRDASLKTKRKTEVTEPVRLPVYGIRRGTSAMLAIADQGDALCSITALTSGMNSDWNTAYFTFRYREYDTITLNEMGWNERSIPYVSKKPNSSLPFTVQYYFLDGEESDYIGMAKIHREYLIQKGAIKQTTQTAGVPFLIDADMSVRRTKAVLGLPTEVVEPLTTFNELGEMIQEFKKAGAESVVVKMNGWQSGGPNYRVTDKVSYEKSIGGKSGFRNFAKTIQNDPSIHLYPSGEFVSGYRNGNGFISFLQGNRDITGALSLQYEFLRSTGTKNLMKAPWNLITPSFSLGLLDRYLQSYDEMTENKINGIALDGYGEILYADRYESILNGLASKIPADRQSAMNLWQQGMEAASKKAGSLMVTGGNSYVFPYADYITGIPMTSSEQKISSDSVPYYQILISGMIRTASTPVNFSEDQDEFCLKCLSTGTYPLYSLFAKESSLVKNTDLDTLYNGEYSLWIDTAMKKYKELYPAYKAIEGASITDYRQLASDRTRTSFDNGVEIEIDYSNHSYILTGGEKNK